MTATAADAAPTVRQAWRGEWASSGDQEWDFGAWTNPLTGAPLVYVVGVALHMLGVSPAWPLIAGVLFGVAFYGAALARGLRRLGVVYTLASAGVATTWLTYACVVLTFDVHDWTKTLSHVIAGAVITLPLAVVWALLIRDAGRAIQEKWAQAAAAERSHAYWEKACASAGIKDWHTQKVVKNADATTVDMRIKPGGTTYAQALTRTDALELALDANFNGAVRIERPQGKGVACVQIRLARKSTLAEPVPAPDVAAAPQSILEPIADARFDDGQTSSRVHAYQTVITLGQRDSGKTGLQNMRVDAYAACNDVLLLGVDFKEGRWLRPWLEPYALGTASKPVFAGVGASVAAVDMMLDGLLAIGDYRAGTGGGDKITPTPQQPAIRLEIDEIADLLADPRHQAVAAKLVKVVRKLRSEGIDVDLASQRGTMSFLGSAARDLLSQATIVDLLRVDSAAEVYNALSIPADKLGSVDPTTFEHPGTKLTLARGARLAAARTYLLPPEDVPVRAFAYADRRPNLEPGAIAAADKATRGEFSRMLAFDTPDARALLHAAAGHTTHHNHDTDNDDAETTSTATAPPRSPAPTAGGTMRDQLIAAHGETEGDRIWHKAKGRMALIAMRTLLAGCEYKLTRDVLDGLAAADPPRWGDLDAKTLAGLVGQFDVEPVQIRAENNARGYRRTDVEEAFNT